MTGDWREQGFGQRTRAEFEAGREDYRGRHELQQHRSERTPARIALGLGLAGLGFGVAQLVRSQSRKAGVPVEGFTTVSRSPKECYRFWRDFANLPRFMKHLQSVHVIDERRALFSARHSRGSQGEWVTELVEDIPNRYLAWRSLPGSSVDHSGSVRFEATPSGNGTIVRVQMRFRPSVRKPRALAARLFNENPDVALREDLRRFKQLLEAGDSGMAFQAPPRQRGIAGRRRSFAGLGSTTLS